MSEPELLTTAGALFESNNSISNYTIGEDGTIVDEYIISYPLTEEQLEHIDQYGPKDGDDENTRKEKAKKFKPPRSSLFDRIKARFSDKYLENTVALLGYNTGISKIDSFITKYEISQILNYLFKADVNKSVRLFDMERFRHRPIFCGVNLLYDPVTTDNFNNMHHTTDYFDGDWNNEYNNSKYLPDQETGDYTNRDITFSKTFLSDLQGMAGSPGQTDKQELVALFVRNDFSVGISSVDSKMLGPEAIRPAQYSRVFINKYQYKPTYDYLTILMRSKELRLDPKLATTDNPYRYLMNSTVILESPTLKTNDDEDSQKSESSDAWVDHPCIVFTGQSLSNPVDKPGEPKGYELATYTAVPICSWSYFCSDASGYAGSKAIERLKTVNQCGPFTRVIANGFYSNAISNILQTYTEIDLVKTMDKDGNDTFGFKNGSKIDWESVDVTLRNAALGEYTNRLANADNTSKSNVDDIQLYENAYYRDNENNYSSEYPDHIKKLFDSVYLPRRFAFFRNGDNIHIRQYPAMPLLGALPMQDDYITQLVPIYRSLDETPTEETGINWYINPNDILVNGITSTFYNVSLQPYTKATFPEFSGQGVLFTWKGHRYTGPIEKTNLPKTVEAIKMGAIDKSKEYQTAPITIAPNNYLQYMTNPGSTDEADMSRMAYKEFIKQGCVWQDSDGNEPKKDEAIPNTPPIGIDLAVYADIEKSTEPTHSKAPEEKSVNKKSLTAAITVLVVLVALVVIFIIYRIIKKRKAAAMGVSQGFFCGD